MPSVIAFLDMDYTLLNTSSGLLYVKYLRQTGQLAPRLLLRVAWWTMLYKLSLIDMLTAFPKITLYTRDASAEQLMQQCREWFNTMVTAHLNSSAVDRVRWHQSLGHRAVVISASTQFAVQPVAEHLKIDFMCTRLASDGDRLTGKIVEPACYGSGKIFWAEQLAHEHAAQLSDCYFYTDSYSDRPLLERVGHPIAVNPDARLKRLAQQRGWPILKFY